VQLLLQLLSIHLYLAQSQVVSASMAHHNPVCMPVVASHSIRAVSMTDLAAAAIVCKHLEVVQPAAAAVNTIPHDHTVDPVVSAQIDLPPCAMLVVSVRARPVAVASVGFAINSTR